LSILHVLTPAGVGGGLERVVRALAVGHAARGHRVRIAAVLPGAEVGSQHPFVDEMREADIEVLTTLVPRRGYAQEREAIADLATTLGVDIVHTHGYRADAVASGGPRQRAVPTVSTVHGFTSAGWRNRLYEALQRRALRAFDAVVAVSRPLAARLAASGVDSARLHVVPNAYLSPGPALDRRAARDALGVSADAYLVGWVGRLSSEKGPDVFVDAMARQTDVLGVMVGDGPERARLETRSRGVRWLGVVPRSGTLFRAFDVFVLSSRTEGTPIVLFEAMAAEVPIVATTVGGVPDVLTEAEAVLVPSDDPRRLSEAIDFVRAQPEPARMRAAAARRRLETVFASEPWLARYETVYAAATGRGEGLRVRR
jgi:glycosyltransferase involved in cell wall biosynthesis